jgi:hypothetical protein
LAINFGTEIETETGTGSDVRPRGGGIERVRDREGRSAQVIERAKVLAEVLGTENLEEARHRLEMILREFEANEIPSDEIGSVTL